MSEKRFRELIVRVARRLDAKGILTATDGNISVRLDDGNLLVTPSGCCKGELEPDAILRVDAEGHSSNGKPSSELPLHRAVYRIRHDVRAIVHAHPPYATAYASAGRDLSDPILSEVVLTLGEVPVVPYARPTGEELARSVEPYLAGRRALLLQLHGVLTFAESIERAGHLMESVEHVAHIDFVRRLIGGGPMLTQAQVDELKELSARLGSGR